jgi:hypothetical protein
VGTRSLQGADEHADTRRGRQALRRRHGGGLRCSPPSPSCAANAARYTRLRSLSDAGVSPVGIVLAVSVEREKADAASVGRLPRFMGTMCSGARTRMSLWTGASIVTRNTIKVGKLKMGNQPQEIFNPVAARLRAFSWPDKNVGGHIKPFSETDEELLVYISEWEDNERKGKNARQYCRFQGELQRRYIKQIAAAFPNGELGALAHASSTQRHRTSRQGRRCASASPICAAIATMN